MQIVHCTLADTPPPWATPSARHVADTAFAEDDDALVLFARRDDGEVQAIPEGHLDAEVIDALLKWAAGQR
jgi:hypothetical protein